jgi:hypothetical protein
MKFLKYPLYFIIGFLLVFFAIGLIQPSVSYGHEITVNKSIKEAWAVQQDTTKFDQWLAGFKSIDLISGRGGEVGSTYKVVVKPSEEEPDFEMIETLIAKEDFDHIQLSFDSDMMFFEQTTSFSEVDGKTIIKTASKVSGKGMILRSLFALMELLSGSFQEQEVKNIEALKIVIEKNVTDYNVAS